MGIIYQLTFLVGLALLGIVITIFVFAVAQLGRATEVSSRERQAILSQAEETRAKRIESIGEQIAKAKKTGSLDSSKLSSELQNLTKERTEYEAELKRIQGKLERMKVKGGVLRPGAFFLVTLILSGLAIVLTEGQNYIAVPLWSVSIATLCYGSWEVYKNLRAIEEVTITSQEAVEKLPEAVKRAIWELEEEKKPELKLRLEGKEFPLHVETDSEVELTLMLDMLKGDSAEDINVHFAVPPSFVFPHEKNTVILTSDIGYPDYIDFLWKKDKIIQGLVYRKRVTIKTPPTAGKFNLVYWIFCRGFRTEATELEIVVKELDIPF